MSDASATSDGRTVTRPASEPAVTTVTCLNVTATRHRHLEDFMTVTPAARPSADVAVRRPTAPVSVTVTTATVTAPVTYRLINPWGPHLIGAMVVAGTTTIGAFTGAVLDAVRLDIAAGAVLAALVLVLALSYAHATHWRRAHNPRFKAVDNL